MESRSARPNSPLCHVGRTAFVCLFGFLLACPWPFPAQATASQLEVDPVDLGRTFVRLQAVNDLENGRPEDAVSRLTQLLEHEKGEDARDTSLLLARAFLALGERSRALRILAPLARRYPDDSTVHALMGQVALASGNLAVAARETRIAATQAPDDPLLWVRLGSILWEMEAYREAAEAFRTACTLDGAACTEAGVASAWDRYQSGDVTGALDQIARTRETLPASDPAAPLVHALERRLLQRLSPDPPTHALLRAGVGFDTNPIYDPSQPLLPDASLAESPAGDGLETGGGAAATYATLTVTAGATPVRAGRHALGGDLAFSRTAYLADDQADDFDSTWGRVLVRYRVTLAHAPLRQDLLVRYRGAVMTFDGGPRVEEPERYVFSETHAGLLRWTLSPNEDTQVYLEAHHAWEGYRDIRRVGPAEGLETGFHRFLQGGRVKLYAAASLTAKQAWIDAYDYRAPGLFLGCSWQAPAGIDLAGTARLTHRSYLHSGEYEPWNTLRTDRVMTLATALSHRVGSSWRVELTGRMTRHRSTVALFDYDRLAVELIVGGSY